jgi:hypothetical protein
MVDKSSALKAFPGLSLGRAMLLARLDAVAFKIDILVVIHIVLDLPFSLGDGGDDMAQLYSS